MTEEQEKWKDYQSVFTAAKAGMEQVDKERVKKIVYEMSKDSAHFKNEQRKQANVEAKVAKLRQQAAQLTPAHLSHHTRSMDSKAAMLEAGRDLSRVWLHVDMDAFYASVEELDNPALRHVPMAVGGTSMICTANYLARKFGVRSAMPGFIAKKLCPGLVFVPTNFAKYTAVSQQTRAVFRCYDPDFEAGSLDEAYLDVTAYCNQHGVTGAQVAEEIRRRVREEVHVTCSCGVAPNKMLAKVCSDLNKPDGQYVLPANRDAVMTFIRTLSIRKVPFIGKVTEQTLSALGIHCCQDLLDQRGLVEALFTPKATDFFLRSCLGLGQTRHSPKGSVDEPWRKGISCERTFRALSEPKQLDAKLQELVSKLAEQMAQESIEGKTFTLKLKATSFSVVTRATTLPAFASKPQDMLPPLQQLLRAEMPIDLRLMGVRASNLRKIGPATAPGSLEHFITRIRSPSACQPPDEAGYNPWTDIKSPDLVDFSDHLESPNRPNSSDHPSSSDHLNCSTHSNAFDDVEAPEEHNNAAIQSEAQSLLNSGTPHQATHLKSNHHASPAPPSKKDSVSPWEAAQSVEQDMMHGAPAQMRHNHLGACNNVVGQAQPALRDQAPGRRDAARCNASQGGPQQRYATQGMEGSHRVDCEVSDHEMPPHELSFNDWQLLSMRSAPSKHYDNPSGSIQDDQGCGQPAFDAPLYLQTSGAAAAAMMAPASTDTAQPRDTACMPGAKRAKLTHSPAQAPTNPSSSISHCGTCDSPSHPAISQQFHSNNTFDLRRTSNNDSILSAPQHLQVKNELDAPTRHVTRNDGSRSGLSYFADQASHAAHLQLGGLLCGALQVQSNMPLSSDNLLPPKTGESEPSTLPYSVSTTKPPGALNQATFPATPPNAHCTTPSESLSLLPNSRSFVASPCSDYNVSEYNRSNHSSTLPMQLATARASASPHVVNEQTNKPASAKSPWVCTACTFAGNRPHQLRCEVCDTLRAGVLSWETSRRGAVGHTTLSSARGGHGTERGKATGRSSRGGRESRRNTGPSITRYLANNC